MCIVKTTAEPDHYFNSQNTLQTLPSREVIVYILKNSTVMWPHC